MRDDFLEAETSKLSPCTFPGKLELEEGTAWAVKSSRHKEHLIRVFGNKRKNGLFGDLQGLWFAWDRVHRQQKWLNCVGTVTKTLTA